MHILAYLGVAAAAFLAIAALERAMQALERYYRIKDTREDNAELLEKQRAMAAQIRRLESRLSTQDYQRSSALEEQLQKAQAENSRLRRELKVKDSLLQAVNGKITAKAQEVTNG